MLAGVEHAPPLLFAHGKGGEAQSAEKVVGGKNGANDPDRTDDLLITNELLYQLSYVGATGNTIAFCHAGRQASRHITWSFPLARQPLCERQYSSFG